MNANEPVDRLIDRSSLGAKGVERLARRSSPSDVAEILRREALPNDSFALRDESRTSTPIGAAETKASTERRLQLVSLANATEPVVSEVSHSNIADFAAAKVNLPADTAARHREQVKRLRERLQVKIDADPTYGLVKMLHAGSVAKGTALRTVDDLDTAIYVKRAAAPDADRDLVPWLADRLFEAAPSNMTRDQFVEEAHCVTVNYKGSGLNVDVVPVLYEGEPNDIGYLVNRTTGARMLTSITLHLRFIRDRKKAYGPQFAELIRLTKWWRRQARNNDHPDLKFKSFMIELIWAHLADNGLALDDYPTALESFFEFVVKTEFDDLISFTDFCTAADLPNRGSAAIEVIDPVNPENNVAVRYDDHAKRIIVDACNDAFDALCEARFATTKTRAVDCWQRVLGPSFRG